MPVGAAAAAAMVAGGWVGMESRERRSERGRGATAGRRLKTGE